ncbi:MAG: glycosyltransferase [Calditrichaeota bacterium]|nr:MAG: glycosyltransferase [Calditrichota bacterium]
MEQKHPSVTAQSERNSPEDPIRISIVIVNYNVKPFVQQVLHSLEKSLKQIPSEIFVVDNASDDGSQKMIQEQFPQIHLIANTQNIGFSRANNQAIKKSRGAYIVLLNPDTITQEDTFSKMLEFMDMHKDAGMATCKVLNPDGSLQLACRRSYPTPWVAFTRLIGLSYFFPNSKLFGRYNLTYLPENETTEVEAISGSFMMVRRHALEQIGLLDEEFFLYGEDLDWCYRTIEAGWKIYYAPITQLIHFKGESSKQSHLDGLLIFYKAMALFVKKHFRKRYFFITYQILLFAIWTRAGLSFLQNSMRTAAVPAFDLLLLQISLLASLYFKFGHLSFWIDYLPVNIVYSAVWLSCLIITGSYGKWKFSSSKAGFAILSGFLINSAITYFFKDYAYSRAVMLFAGGMNFFLISGWRFFLKFLHRFDLAPFHGTLGHTLLARPTLLVGDFSKGEKVLEKLRTRIGAGYDIIGLVSINPEDIGKEYNGVSVLTTLESLDETVHRRKITEVIFSTQRISYDHILAALTKSRSHSAHFKIIPSNLDVVIGKASIDQLSDAPLLDIEYKLASNANKIKKRMFDFIVSLLCLTFAMPVFFVYFIFNKSRWQKINLPLTAGKRHKVLKVGYLKKGRFLAKLPLMWYVLKGDLSIVGRELFDYGIQGDSPLILVKPGLTGLTQVGRNRKLSADEKEKYRLFYIMNYSILLDIEIIFKTIFKI